MSPCPPLILELVERFTLNKDRYLSSNYNEEQLRHEFLNPMFEILGWDMTNKKGFSDAYKEVLYEESIKAGAPDYSFRIGGNRKFFVEAKAPNINIATDSRSAAQLRSYAWSAKLSLSILTDFTNFAVYDGRIPVRSELPAPGEARVLLIPFTDYPTRWNEIESIFSQQAIGKGLYDRFADSKTPKRGTAPVDEEFLNQISHWRERLASSLREANPALTAPELNFAVQMIIDRIVFLRIAEDRGLETYGQLQTIAKVHNIFGELLHLFQAADTRYNSGLFHFRAEPNRSSLPDDLTPSLDIGDTVLQDVITSLYPPRSHYRFSHVPSEILGQVYEQFLGKVIVLTPKRARVEDKPEVRKAGGVYYTPSYIVQYIVDNTLGKLLEDKAPDEAAKLKVLDPACGSGSFLLGAYQKLLDWHLDYYYHHDPDKLARGKNPPIRQIAAPASSGLFESKPSYRLTIAERKRILLNNIFGVDIDTQAVEVTKLSLLLKCLEDETAESVQSLLKFMRQRALPDLDDNIKCGNSLIASDFYDPAKFPENQNLSEGDRRHINVFDWKQGFPAVMKSGGFDSIIGNPPYIPPELLADHERLYFVSLHKELERKYDTSVVFILSMLRQLNLRGRLGYISSITWQTGTNYGKVRGRIFKNAGLDVLINLPFDVFPDAYVDTGVYVLTRSPRPTYKIYRFPKKAEVVSLNDLPLREIPSSLVTAPDFRIILDADAHSILRGISTRQAMTTVGDLTVSTQGLAGNRFSETTKPVPQSYPYLSKGQVHRYDWRPQKTSFVSMRAFPTLTHFYDAAPKILIRRVISRQDRILATYFSERMVFKKDINPFICKGTERDAKFLLGIVNSKLISYIYINTSSIATKDDFRQTTLAELRSLPVPANPDLPIRDRIVKSVEAMLALYQKLHAAKLPTDKIRLQREIAATDSQIDALVYDLYQLTPKEIQDIEAATGANSHAPPKT